MTSPIIQDAEPYSPQQIVELKRQFNKDGFLLLREVLTPEEVAALRAAVDEVFEGPHASDPNRLYGPIIATRLFECGPIFEDMLTREPIIGLVESILGADCHLIAQNVVRNGPGQALDFFHADDLVIFPVAEGMERHDPGQEMPVFILTVQIPLTDIPSDEYGPTQFVPGSHFSGRKPGAEGIPTFEGEGPHSILCKAGDIYLHNGQCWHRGAPNTSDRTRYLFQLSFGRRWVSQRFYPFVNYKFPEGVIERADERRKRVLGFHPSGAYG